MRDENSGLRPSTSLYERDRIRQVPYAEVNGIRTVSDKEIYHAFEVMASEGSLKTVFYQGQIKDSETFLKFIKNADNIVSFLFLDKEAAGFAWINGMNGNYCFAHFCLFKNVWKENTETIGNLLLDYWMSFTDKDGDRLFDVIIGMIPAFNTKAIRYIKKLGFVIVGEIPMMADLKYTGDKGPLNISYYGG